MAGKLVTVVGPMGSGKTERLIETYNKFKDLNMHVTVFKPATDTRNSMTEVRSRNGLSVPAIAINSIKDVLDYNDDLGDVILIDEMQFFTDLDDINWLLALCVDGIDIFCFGLDLTSDFETFGIMGDLMAVSDEVVKLKTKCVKCGSDARVSSYKGSGKKSIVKVGDLDEYEPLCLNCYLNIDYNHITDFVEYDTDSDNDQLLYFEINCEKEDLKIELFVKQSTLDKAGYTPDDVRDINTVEGIENLLNDLGLVEGGLYE